MAQPSVQVSTSVICQFNRLSELRSTLIDITNAPMNHFRKHRHTLPTLFQIIQQASLLKVLDLGSLPMDPATIAWTMPILWRHPSLEELKLWSRGIIRVSDIRSILWYSTGLKKFTWLQDSQGPAQIASDCDLVSEARIQELQSLFSDPRPNSVEVFHYLETRTAAALASYRLEELDLRTAPIPHHFSRNPFLPFLRGYCPNLKRVVYPWIPGNDDPELDFDPYLPGLPKVLYDSMGRPRHLDFRNVNHAVDEMMETILESCHQLETFHAPGGETSFGDLSCSALLDYHAQTLQVVSFAKCGISNVNMICVLQQCPNLQRFRALVADVEQDVDNLEQADPENEDENEDEGESENEGRDPLEDMMVQDKTRHFFTGFMLLMDLPVCPDQHGPGARRAVVRGARDVSARAAGADQGLGEGAQMREKSVIECRLE
ncbi:hypothetical protein BG005_010490 [Podila minutissima]|nr:hypothetical protein BG005_010490 [Podila minutissima]